MHEWQESLEFETKFLESSPKPEKKEMTIEIKKKGKSPDFSIYANPPFRMSDKDFEVIIKRANGEEDSDY